MPCPHLILLGGFAGTHQIAQRLGTFIRNSIPQLDLQIESNVPASPHRVDLSLLDHRL
jgi:hypothetical protein